MAFRSFSAVIFVLTIVVGSQPALGTLYIRDDATGGDATSIGDWDSLTKTCTLTGDVSEDIRIESDGITLDGAGYTVDGPGAGSGVGVRLDYRTGITIKNLNVRNFDYGIYLQGSNDNTLTWNNISSNSQNGIGLRNSSNNELTDNKTDWNGNCGISLFINCDNNTVTGNSSSNNYRGISVLESSRNKLTENTVDSCDYGIQLQDTSSITVTDNTVTNGQGKGHGILLFNTNDSTLERNTVDSYYYTCFYIQNSTNNSLTENTANSSGAGIYIHGCTDFILADNSASSNNGGIHLQDSTRITLEGNAAQSNIHNGISFTWSDYNTLTGNVISSNGYNGIYFVESDDNELKENTSSNNLWYGIRLTRSCNNQIYNNNFIDNSVQAAAQQDSTGNVFFLPAPLGGNYWNGWTSPDADNDGFVDNPYEFDGGQDDLPWAVQDGWLSPEVLIGQLIARVKALNLNQGIDNSLDTKLQNALAALEAANAGQRQDAVNKMQSFISAVEAQRGKSISETEADTLITAAQYIIDRLTAA